jgi:hypothetical protein
MRKNSVWLVGALTVSAACGVESPSEGPRVNAVADVQGLQPGVSLPFELGGVVERAQRAYRVEGGVAVAQRPTYEVRGGPAGLRFTPRAYHLDPRADLVRGIDPAGDPQNVLEGAEVRFETVSIARGEAFDLGAGESWVAEDGTLRIDRGVAQERFINETAEVEQQWHFDVPPVGDGDLVIRVEVHGQTWVGWDEAGHHFIDEASEVGVVYGPATWVDALGRQTALEVVYDDGSLVLTVPAETVETSAYPAILDPTIGTEFQLTTVGIGPSAFVEQKPAVAFNPIDLQYVVVWADQRNGRDFDIYAARLTNTGTLLDTTGVPLCTSAFDQTQPDIAWNGTSFYVVWQDGRSNDGFDIYGTVVSSTLGSSDANGTPLETAGGDQLNPSVDNNGPNFAIVWQDARNGTPTIWGTRLDQNGVILAPGPVPFDGNTGRAQTFPDVSCQGEFCLAVWEQSQATLYEENIHGARMRAQSGAVVDATSFTISTASRRQLRPAIENDGTNFLVVWQDGRSGSRYDIYQNRVNALTSSVAYGPGFQGIPVVAVTAYQWEPDLAFYEGGYVVSWSDARVGGTASPDIFAARVQPNSTVVEANGFSVTTVAGIQGAPAVAGGGSRFMVVWEDSRTGRSDIVSTTINLSGIVQNFGGVTVSTAGSRQLSGEVVFDGRYYFAVFSDSRGSGHGNYDLKAVRVTGTGSVLDPAGRNISLAAGRQLAPDVTWNGTEFMVVWTDDRAGNFNVYGQRVSNGYVNVGGEIPIAVGDAEEGFPRLAWNAGGTTYLVVWEDRRSGQFDIYGRILNADGSFATDEFVISDAVGDQRLPDVASNNVGWQVVWQDRRSGVANTEDIYGAQVATDGTVDAEFTVSTAADRQLNPRIAFDGTNYMAVWADRRRGEGNTDIYGSRISAAGLTLDAAGLGLATTALDESRPNLVLHSGTWFVAWRRQTADGSAFDLYGSRYQLDGTPIAVPGGTNNIFVISAAPGNEDQPAIADYGSAGATLVVYQRFDEQSSARSERMFARTIFFP